MVFNTRMKFVFFFSVISLISCCPNQLEVVFVADRSGSIGSSNWMVLKDFLIQVSTRFQVGQSNVRVSAITYSDQPTNDWTLDGSQTMAMGSLTTNLASLSYDGGSTGTGYALQMAWQNLQISRPNVQRIVVVITDGKSNGASGGQFLDREALALKSIPNTRVVVFGIGSNIDRNELNSIASSSCDVHLVSDYNSMDNNMATRMDEICGCMPGYKRNANCGCTPCPMGQYNSMWGQTTCERCATGQTSEQGALQCAADCPVGTYRTANNQNCMSCPMNTYQYLRNQDSCINCSNDRPATRMVGATSLSDCKVKCDRGQYDNWSNICVPCDIGSYQPSEFATMCTPCPDGFTTLNIGTTQLSDCLMNCGTGNRLNEHGMCDQCEQGTYQSMTNGRNCTPCPDGYSTRGPGAMSPGDCKIVCQPGYQPDPDEMECEPCEPGTFNGEIFGTSCRVCEDGTTTEEEGMRACAVIAKPMTGGAVAGIVIGVLLALLLLLGLLILFLCWNKKKAYAESRMHSESRFADVTIHSTEIITKEKKLADSVRSTASSYRYTSEPSKTESKDNPGYEIDPKYDNVGQDTAADPIHDNEMAAMYDIPPTAKSVKPPALYDNFPRK